jgi:hypothetical protein
MTQASTLAMLGVVFFAAACVTPPQPPPAPALEWGSQERKILFIPPHFELTQPRAGPRTDWNEAAAEATTRQAQIYFSSKGMRLLPVAHSEGREPTCGGGTASEQFPTPSWQVRDLWKEPGWRMGVRACSGADYLLFIQVSGLFETQAETVVRTVAQEAGELVLMGLTAGLCCPAPYGGMDVRADASVVDLRTGAVVWTFGDVNLGDWRADASSMIALQKLLSGFFADQAL